MRKIFLIIVTLTLLFSKINSQSIIPTELHSFSNFIESHNGIQASGCFLVYNKYCYLVTARHVLLKEVNNSFYLTDTLFTVTSYPRDPMISQKNILKIHLKDIHTKHFIKYNKLSDIAAIQIAGVDSIFTRYHEFVEKLSPSTRINQIDTSFTLKYDDILIGNDIFIVGFPSSIGMRDIPQIDYDKPLIKKGIISGKNVSQKTIILDCQVYPGNSGGPVFEIDLDYSTIPLSRKISVIGIISQFVPFNQEWVNKLFGATNIEIGNSGYSIVVPMEKVIEVLQ